MLVTTRLLFQLIQVSIIYTIHIIHAKKMYIYWVLIDRESDNMALGPYI